MNKTFNTITTTALLIVAAHSTSAYALHSYAIGSLYPQTIVHKAVVIDEVAAKKDFYALLEKAKQKIRHEGLEGEAAENKALRLAALQMLSKHGLLVKREHTLEMTVSAQGKTESRIVNKMSFQWHQQSKL